MRNFVMLSVFFYSAVMPNIFAQRSQPQTLLADSVKSKIGVMVSPGIHYTRIDRAPSAIFDLRAGAIFNDKITVGGFFTTAVNDLVPKSETQPGLYLDYKVFGGFLEYSMLTDRLIHVTVPISIGAAEIEMDSEQRDPGLGEAKFLLIEPGIAGELNLHKNIRINLGVTYRIASQVHYRNMDQSAINGLSAKLGLKIGLFRR